MVERGTRLDGCPAWRGRVRPTAWCERIALPLIAVTTSELRTSAGPAAMARAIRAARDGARAHLPRRGAAGRRLPVVVPPLPEEAVGPFLDRVGRGVPVRRAGPARPPTAPSRTRAWARPSRASTPSSWPSRAPPTSAGCPSWPSAAAPRSSTSRAAGRCTSTCPTPSARRSSTARPRRRAKPTHPVTVAPDSRLATILGRGRLDVNSFHHQAASRMGDGLVPTAAPDGTVEAFEAPGERFLVGVQWHAECLVGRAASCSPPSYRRGGREGDRAAASAAAAQRA